MRILQVRFKNLNSLFGEWAIDLTHPSYVADGIFAITGPTGAGKTTILDAICLALYGRTPRLNKVTRGANEIMSRQTGECFAEVTFATPTGRYRCHWSQHRARKKPDGELQAPKHKIADADSGAIFETKLRGVAEQIEVVTGMDFDRFTRSMLLAQGGFAAFLQAAPDERAPILEQITGTEIYSRISVGVHERRGDERKKLETLQAELAGIQLLSEEEERQLRTDVAEKRERDTVLGEQIAGKNLLLAWLDTIAALEEELKQVHLRIEELHNRQLGFAPEQEKLRQAAKALELAGDFHTLLSIRREQRSERRNLDTSLELLPGLDKAAKQANGALEAALGRVAASKAEQQKAAPIIRTVRELDLKMREKDGPVKAAAAAVAELEKSRVKLLATHSGNRADLETKRTALAGLQKQLDETAADEELVAQLAGILGQFAALHNLRAQSAAKGEESKQAEALVTGAKRVWKEQVGQLASWQRVVAKTREAVAEKRLELRKVMAGQELSDWRTAVASLTARQGLLAELAEAARSLAKSRRALAELGRSQVVLARGETRLAAQLTSQLEKQSSLEQQMAQLEKQFSLLKQIENLETSRQQLRDGEPCPLCGAREHPFAQDTPQVADETGRQLEAVRVELKAVNDTIAQVRVKLAEAGKDRQHAITRQEEHTATVTEAERLIDTAGAEFLLTAATPDLGRTVADLYQEQEKKRAQVATAVAAAEALEKELAGLRETLEKDGESAARAEREAQAAQYKMDSAGQLLVRLREEQQLLQRQGDNSLDLVRQEVSRYRLEVSLDNLDQIREQLKNRRESWLFRQQEVSELVRKIGGLEIQTGHQAEQLKRAAEELAKQRKQLDGLLRERETLHRERQELFADKNPDDEEQCLIEALDKADKSVDEARRNLDGSTRELDALRARIAALEKSLVERDRQLLETEASFLTRLTAADFADEAEFKKACLPEDERNYLAERAQKLADEKTALIAREREVTKLLTAERRKQLGDQGREQLSQAVIELVAAQKEIQQQIGGINQKLLDNEKMEQKRRGRIETVAAQQRECARWEELHDLIGSADGKKFRNFAQGLTFEMMVGHANRQLRKMSDRYLLIRDEQQPLELNVIDNYQAGEVRSTKNLSGGESFLVSLSLALGLSQMASQKVRVDSLFLDEGFGTLDDEALDTALETLAGLQQDGKVIGVISHVPALKERIATRIQVIPETGGRSRIAGPGCRQGGERRP